MSVVVMELPNDNLQINRNIIEDITEFDLKIQNNCIFEKILNENNILIEGILLDQEILNEIDKYEEFMNVDEKNKVEEVNGNSKYDCNLIMPINEISTNMNLLMNNSNKLESKALSLIKENTDEIGIYCKRSKRDAFLSMNFELNNKRKMFIDDFWVKKKVFILDDIDYKKNFISKNYYLSEKYVRMENIYFFIYNIIFYCNEYQIINFFIKAEYNKKTKFNIKRSTTIKSLDLSTLFSFTKNHSNKIFIPCKKSNYLVYIENFSKLENQLILFGKEREKSKTFDIKNYIFSMDEKKSISLYKKIGNLFRIKNFRKYFNNENKKFMIKNKVDMIFWRFEVFHQKMHLKKIENKSEDKNEEMILCNLTKDDEVFKKDINYLKIKNKKLNVFENTICESKILEKDVYKVENELKNSKIVNTSNETSEVYLQKKNLKIIKDSNSINLEKTNELQSNEINNELYNKKIDENTENIFNKKEKDFESNANNNLLVSRLNFKRNVKNNNFGNINKKKFGVFDKLISLTHNRNIVRPISKGLSRESIKAIEIIKRSKKSK